MRFVECMGVCGQRRGHRKKEMSTAREVIKTRVAVVRKITRPAERDRRARGKREKTERNAQPERKRKRHFGEERRMGERELKSPGARINGLE